MNCCARVKLFDGGIRMLSLSAFDRSGPHAQPNHSFGFRRFALAAFRFCARFRTAAQNAFSDKTLPAFTLSLERFSIA